MYPYLLMLACAFHSIYAYQSNLVGRQSTLRGDTQCGTLMCVAATVNGSVTSYVLSGLGRQPVGWMAVGFGRQMANTPMVIMWTNSDGSVTLSQRMAPQEVMPTVDPNPPRRATLNNAMTTISSTTPQLAFTVPTNADTRQSIIFAYGTTNPGSSAVNANLIQHVDYGIAQLNLAQPLPNGAPTLPTNSPPNGSFSLPLLPYQRIIIAHAIFCVIGFIFLLPLGSLYARYMRVYNPLWFKGHWTVQFLLAGLTIVIGVILGIASVAEAGAPHLNSGHKRWGIALFVLYLVQCSIGAVIHFVKDPNRRRRPPQNYFHAVFGLLIIALSLYQVRLGYFYEWPATTGRGALPNGVNTFFWIWVAALPALYGIGLFFLPKQFRQERKRGSPPLDDDERNHFNLSEHRNRNY